MVRTSSLCVMGLLSAVLIVPPRPAGSQETGKTVAAPTATQVAPRTVRESFDALEVDLFENQKDSQFPPEFLVPLQQEITKQLVNAKAFLGVTAGTGSAAANANPRTLQLKGLITNYTAGNRAKRYFGGGAAGAAEIDSQISFVDPSTGQPLMSQDLRAVLAGGFLGGKSEDTLKDYARQVVNKVKLMQNMRVPGPEEVRPSVVPGNAAEVPSAAPAHYKLPITDKSWVDSEQKLNQQAEDGYRLTGLTITGANTAEAAMVRTEAIADAFRYKLLHVRTASNLQKDINVLAAEGYRVSPNTLVVLGTYPTVIVEKSAPPFKANYQYILKETILVSSGQKDIETIQKQGYTLIGETEHKTEHILLFEKGKRRLEAVLTVGYVNGVSWG